MKHYLTEQEFKDRLLRLNDGEIDICCESDNGTEHIRFRATTFFYKVILYSYPFTNDIGLIQENEEGWDEPLHEVWYDITEQCGYKPFYEL